MADPRLVVKPFAKDDLVVIASRRHAWAKRESITSVELSKEPFIISEKGSAMQEIILRSLQSAGMKLNVTMELGNIEAVKKAVEAGLGISIISRCAVLREAEANRLKVLRVSSVSLHRNLSFVWRKGKHLSKATEAFLDFFTENIATVKGVQKV